MGVGFVINNRPTYLIDDPNYAVIPSLPLGLDLGTVPDWIKRSMLHLGGVQPLTGEMAKDAGFILENRPSKGELELYRRNGTRFQSISVVTSIAAFREVDGVKLGVPYAISLIPASKRGTVLSNVGAEYVKRIDLNLVLQRQQPCYVDFNPFTGHWGAWGAISIFFGAAPRAAYPDGLGLVTDMYHLQLRFDPEDVGVVDLGMGKGTPLRRYLRHRTKLMFSPFETFHARRVWGAESPIELFLLQALLRENLTPLLQMLLFDDGSSYPSIYDLWAQDLRDLPGLVTEADMFFPDQRLAIFCDSTRYHPGGKAARKDQAVSRRLEAAGIRSVGVPGALIVRDLKATTELILAALS
jgi:hypothetical protein